MSVFCEYTCFGNSGLINRTTSAYTSFEYNLQDGPAKHPNDFGLHCSGIDWIVLGCIRLDWNELDCVGLSWIVLEWIGCICDWSEINFTRRIKVGMDLDWSRLDWSGLDCNARSNTDWIEVVLIRGGLS